MADARRRYDEQARWDHFQHRAREWRELTEHRAFLAAMCAAVGEYPGPQRDDLVAQPDSAGRRLDGLDPLRHPELLLPDVPEPKPDDLEPFLDGWSPNGPGSAGW